MEEVFAEDSVNFGDYSSFFLMVHTDANGTPAFDSDYTSPSGEFVPVIWMNPGQAWKRK